MGATCNAEAQLDAGRSETTALCLDPKLREEPPDITVMLSQLRSEMRSELTALTTALENGIGSLQELPSEPTRIAEDEEVCGVDAEVSSHD